MNTIKKIKIKQEIRQINKIDGLLKILFKQIVKINEIIEDIVIFDKIKIVDIINLKFKKQFNLK